MNARALVGVLALALVFAGCGGKELGPGADEGGAGSSGDEAAVDAGSGIEGGGGTGYCVYQTCSGLSLCGAGDTCPVGDGCNTCTCTGLGGDNGSSSCTTNACSCGGGTK
jgi:hypothetical protein